MAASSQYHRGTTTPHSHYHSLPSNHEHLYANLATSWHSSHGLSRTPGPSTLLQRFSTSAQRPFGGGHYYDYGGSSDYVNPHPHPQGQPSWPANYLRPATPQAWSESLSDESFATRSLPYGGDVEGRAPAPQHDPPRARAQQHPSEVAHIALLNAPDQTYRTAEPHEQQLSSVSSSSCVSRNNLTLPGAFRRPGCPTILTTSSQFSPCCTSAELSTSQLARQSSACIFASTNQLASEF